jgi:hypothetical protein
MEHNFVFGERTFHGDFYTTQDGNWAILFRRDGRFVIYERNSEGKYDHTRFNFGTIEEVNKFIEEENFLLELGEDLLQEQWMLKARHSR